MPRGRPSPKLAITVDPDVHAAVLAAALEDGTSVSAWMTDAARDSLRIRDGLRSIREYQAGYGAFTETELDVGRRMVDAELDAVRRAYGDSEIRTLDAAAATDSARPKEPQRS